MKNTIKRVKRVADNHFLVAVNNNIFAEIKPGNSDYDLTIFPEGRAPLAHVVKTRGEAYNILFTVKA